MQIMPHVKWAKSLTVFGSVTQGGFKDGQSDIDFLVEFESISAQENI
jgi:predicted nucleotidyltransferase